MALGVGAGIVKVLCSEGWRCCVHCNSNRTLAEKTVAQIREAGGEAILLQADVSDPAQAKALVEQTVQQWGRLDLLVNNAAMQYNMFIENRLLNTDGTLYIEVKPQVDLDALYRDIVLTLQHLVDEVSDGR